MKQVFTDEKGGNSTASVLGIHTYRMYADCRSCCVMAVEGFLGHLRVETSSCHDVGYQDIINICSHKEFRGNFMAILHAFQ